MRRRVVLATVALILAVAAGGSAYAYLHNIQQRAYRNATLVPVYRVEKPVVAGTPASVLLPKGLVGRSRVPEQFRPSGAVTDLATLSGELATSPIPPGQVLDASQFAAPASAASSSPAGAIPHGDVAISVAVDQVHGVAGLIQPGDRVDILIELNGKPSTERFLYQDVPVLAVGSTTVSTTGSQTVADTAASATTSTTTPSSTSSGLITFAVPPAAAQRVALAESNGAGVSGELYLALVPANGQAPPAVNYRPVDAKNLIPVKPTP